MEMWFSFCVVRCANNRVDARMRQLYVSTWLANHCMVCCRGRHVHSSCVDCMDFRVVLVVCVWPLCAALFWLQRKMTKKRRSVRTTETHIAHRARQTNVAMLLSALILFTFLRNITMLCVVALNVRFHCMLCTHKTQNRNWVYALCDATKKQTLICKPGKKNNKRACWNEMQKFPNEPFDPLMNYLIIFKRWKK